MKKLAFFLTLMLMLTTCCDRMSQHERVLADIDSLTETDADSARHMLLRMSKEGAMKDASEDAKAYFNLLRVKADDKAKVKHTSDSLIGSAVEHFERQDRHGHLPETYYYMGRVNADLLNGEKAILYFHKALLTDSLNNYPRLRSRCYAQIGYIYLRNGLLDEALDMQQLAHFYCKEIGDTLGMRYSSEDIQTIKKMQKDSIITSLPKTEIMVHIQKLHAQVRNQVLNSQNTRLEAENSKERLFVWMVSIAALIVIITATFLVLRLRKQRALRKEEAAEIFLSSRSKRQFYDKDINQLLTTHIYNNKVLKETDWRKMEAKLSEAFPSFREQLFALYPLSDTEYHICMLIKMEVSPSHIAKLMAIGNSAVSQNRLRMQQKIFDGQGTAKDWDKFILSL